MKKNSKYWINLYKKIFKSSKKEKTSTIKLEWGKNNMLGLKHFSKILVVLLLCGLLVCGMQTCTACTAVYVGPDVSADGSTIIARSNDFQDVWASHLTVTPRVENQPGRFMPLSMDGKVKVELPATTYKYTATPFMNSTMVDTQMSSDSAACTNEYGVAMTMSITAFSNNATMKADPWVKEGLTENTATDLIICQSKTAREGVEKLCGLIDKYGSSESNIALIADQNEVWYVEMYSGHQYAAVKLPSDKVSVFGNEFTLEYLSDYEDNITSKELTSLPEENGFAVYGKNNEINLFDTYSGKEVTADYCHMRTWMGHQILAPSNFSADFNLNTVYPLCFTPDQNVSMKDVCEIMRNRFNGTEYSPDETRRFDMRVVGTDTALSTHIIQVYPDLPADMSCITWYSCGPALYGVFVPFSNDCINVSEAYGADQPAKDKKVFDTEHYPYYVFKDLSTRCVGPDNYKIYGEPVQTYWKEAEGNMFSGMAKVIKEAAKMNNKDARAKYITSYCNDMQNKAFNDGKEILNDVTWTQSKNSNTYKIERDPETHKPTGKKEVIPPMNVTLNATKYKDVPEAHEGGFQIKLPFT